MDARRAFGLRMRRILIELMRQIEQEYGLEPFGKSTH